MALANTSLPVPLSPVSRTVAELEATCRAVSTVARIVSLVPMMSCCPRISSSCRRSSRFSAINCCFSRALRTTLSVVAVVNGFSRKS